MSDKYGRYEGPMPAPRAATPEDDGDSLWNEIMQRLPDIPENWSTNEKLLLRCAKFIRARAAPPEPDAGDVATTIQMLRDIGLPVPAQKLESLVAQVARLTASQRIGREPTTDMIEAAINNDLAPISMALAAEVWRAMYDAAAGTTPEPKP